MPSVDTVKTVTALLIVGAIVLLIVYDLVVYAFFGSDPTISRTCYNAARASASSKAFVMGFVFALGVLAGHIFLPQHVK